MKESIITNIQVDQHLSSWISTKLTSNLLADETQFLQFGFEEEFEFSTVEFENPVPSSFNVWPTKEKPDTYYKIVSAFLTLSMDQNVIERQTYSFLDWLGDIGGLYDALRLIGLFVVAPFSSLKQKAELLFNVFRFTKSLRFAD